MLMTFAEVQASEDIIDAAGCDPSTPSFASAVNKAVRMLLIRGDWRGTIVPIQVCVRRGCITMPRYVGAIRKINLCNTPLETKNVWWKFLPAETYRMASCPWLGWSASVQQQTEAPVYSDIYGEGRYLRIYLTDIRDVNKTVTVFGEDNNGQIYQQVFSLVAPSTGTGYAQSNTYVRRIDRVSKDRTYGRVVVVAYDTATGSVEEVATYDPSETNPELMRIKLNYPGTSCSSGVCSTGTSNCGDVHSLAALVKFRFIPVVDPTDLVMLPSIDALEFMIHSIRSSQCEDQQSRKEYEAAAIRELNLDIWNYAGDDTIVVTDDPFNGVQYLGVQRCF